ncbi:MAG TPA: malate dehydrogenase [Nitrospirae bacterium]|nr:malate dehydrogenase [Nitrospirota bacterium]
MVTMKEKVSIIGAGNVGATLAQLVARSGLADIVLFDVVRDMPQGKALDLSESCPLWNVSVRIKGTNDYSDIKDSNIVVITAGIARKPGMSRDDLLTTNAAIIRAVSSELVRYCPDAVVIVVTNPMDAMAQVVLGGTGFEPNRIMGMGGILDSSRFRTFVADELGISYQDTEALVLGGHGDQMVPMPRYTTVRGIPITELMDRDKIESLIERTRNGGAEIVGLLRSGSAYYAPASSAFQMVKSVLLDEKRVVPCAALLNGEYGIKGVFAGVPVILGSNGVEKIIELQLDDSEKAAFLDSIKSLERLLSKI